MPKRTKRRMLERGEDISLENSRDKTTYHEIRGPMSGRNHHTKNIEVVAKTKEGKGRSNTEEEDQRGKFFITSIT